jgi:flagellar protein FliT
MVTWGCLVDGLIFIGRARDRNQASAVCRVGGGALPCKVNSYICFGFALRNYQFVGAELAGKSSLTPDSRHRQNRYACGIQMKRPRDKKLSPTMLSPLTLMEHYKGIEDCSRQMLDAACTANWCQLTLLSGTCGTLIAQLGQSATGGTLSPLERQERSRILQRILRTDAQIRYLAEPSVARYEWIHTAVNVR